VTKSGDGSARSKLEIDAACVGGEAVATTKAAISARELKRKKWLRLGCWKDFT
jgi:hypothetical protein